ncbi:MAG: cytoplasmic protein [Acidobacteriota bacterium]
MGTPKVQPSAGEDPVRVDAKHYQIEFEDERVRVVRARYGPREKSAMHGHPRLVGVCLTDVHSRFMYPDGRSEEVRAKAGQVMHFDALEHLPENLSDQPMELILVELKG